MSRDILVVKTKILLKHGMFQGLIPLGYFDFDKIIRENFEYMERNDALENNPEYKQIIPYIWIVNKKNKSVFLYKRGTGNGEYKEVRYLNNYSGGIGGHIDRDTEESTKDPITHAMLREMNEEVIIDNYPSPKIVGFINDEADSLGKVHFAVLAIAETDSDVKLAEEGLREGSFYSIADAEKALNDPSNKVEGWTRISWPFVKEYLLTI